LIKMQLSLCTMITDRTHCHPIGLIVDLSDNVSCRRAQNVLRIN
jgi:hypothetical protein